MNERIKELADQATCDIKDIFGHWVGREFDIEKFAELIAAAEREACAKLCDDNADIEHWQDEKSGGIRTGLHAKLIRARGQA